ncbi:uncharacterized protein [Euphorbia lathyris]|uniref:uncharacterized protein n=1 Tax=Euphorbia lathyris TaxID=212925 RepID=UPI003314483D
MSEGGMTLLDGTDLRSLHLSLPDSTVTLTGAELLDFVESKASESLFGLSLPHHLKSSALLRLNLADDLTFRRQQLTREAAVNILDQYVTAIADELNENPLVVSVLNGNTLRLFLEDEDDFAMLAENLFTDLDVKDKGKISKSEVRNALLHMGVEMGIPPLQELPMLNDILKKHGAEGEEELGQAQFAELLQPILEEIADTLAKKHIVVVQNIKIVNGSKLRKVLSDEKQLNKVAEKMLQEKRSNKDDENNMKTIRSFLEENGNELGLPPSEANETVLSLYDSVFADIEIAKFAAESESELRELVKETLEKFAEQLEANPVYCDIDI